MGNIGGGLEGAVQHLFGGDDVVEEADLLHLFGQQDAAGEVETPWLGRALAAGTIPDRLRYVTERATELIPVGRPGSVDDVVAMVAYLARDDAEFVTGQVLSVNGGSSMG